MNAIDTPASPARLGLREQAKIDRYQRIRAAAEQLFNQRGYEHTTTKEVAELAGVGEATLFRYITTKHELLLLVIGERMDLAIQAIEEADNQLVVRSPTARNYIERIYTIYKSRARFYVSDPENVTSYLHYGFRAGTQLGAQSISQGDRVIDLTASILNEAHGAGQLIAEVDFRTVAQNCNATYIHEVLRAPVRDFGPEDFWERLKKRLKVQIEPLFRISQDH